MQCKREPNAVSSFSMNLCLRMGWMPMERRRRQFMVDVFRSFGLPVIISSVDATERAGEYQRYTDSGVVCMVFPTFPRVQDPRIDNLPEEFRVVIENSRPLFANLALKYLDEHPFGATNGPLFVEFMDAMTGELAQQFTEHKHQFFIRFWTYQFMLFLAASYVRGACPHSMRLHFGQMAESRSFELCLQRFDSVYKAEESPESSWRRSAPFPPLDRDVLLYLCLLGGKHFRALSYELGGDPCTFAASVNQARQLQRGFIFGYSARSEDDKLEGVVAGAIVLASHLDGFAGISFPRFFAAFLYELNLKSTPDTTIEVPDAVHDLIVPFLAPPNRKWPSFLPMALNLGNLSRLPTWFDVDIEFCDGQVTVETQNCEKSLPVAVMKRILRQIPDSSRVHLVVTKGLQRAYVGRTSL